MLMPEIPHPFKCKDARKRGSLCWRWVTTIAPTDFFSDNHEEENLMENLPLIEKIRMHIFPTSISVSRWVSLMTSNGC